ncbi:MAG: FAD-dependent oxidoreductase [Actinomycetota bacterium]|nr:FAD-dependent oxidoreductase [Actinomycetota bacterium]
MASTSSGEPQGDEGIRSLWVDTTPETAYPAVAGDDRYDVVVVGGGITGLTTAYLLKESGARVAVVERHRVASGTTGNTTAKVSSLHSLTYAQLVDKRGEEIARLYGEANQAAVERISTLVTQLGVDCQFERAPAYSYTESQDSVGQVEAEVEAATRLGLPASYTEQTDLPYRVRAAVRFENQAHFHPRRYCLALAAAVDGDGCSVFEQTDALAVDEQEDRVVVRTSSGALNAEQLVVATLLPFVDRGGFFAKAHPTRSYAMAVRISGDVPRGMYLSLDSPTRSLRPARYRDTTGLVLGGASHHTGREEQTSSYYQDIEDWARATFDVEGVDYRWSAQDYTTLDSVPYVGRSPRSARTFVATGFKKWGMTNGTAGAMLLADTIGGRDNPWTEVFDATRIGGAQSVAKAVKANLEVGKDFVTDHVGRRLQAASVEDLGPGEAGVVKVEGRSVGAYRDSAGILHVVSITCTHMACTLRWNQAETTWDCPCHGSRFSAEGRVLEGPAVKDLERIHLTE